MKSKRFASSRETDFHTSEKRQRQACSVPWLETNKVVELRCNFRDTPEKTELPQFSRCSTTDTKRVAVLVPFRDSYPTQKRRAHLDEFVPYLTNFLQRHCSLNRATFHIFIIEQSLDSRKFNRGKLLNAGFDIARNDYDIFIFHDVDLLPGDELGECYTTVPSVGPMHIARLWERYSDSSTYFGGIVAFTSKHFIKVNGFPNNFWGWGGEDNELYSRVMRKKLVIQAPTRWDTYLNIDMYIVHANYFFRL